MKGGTPSCVSVTIPQAHLHLALMYEERDDSKTPALRVLKQNKKPGYSLFAYSHFAYFGPKSGVSPTHKKQLYVMF